MGGLVTPVCILHNLVCHHSASIAIMLDVWSIKLSVYMVCMYDQVYTDALSMHGMSNVTICDRLWHSVYVVVHMYEQMLSGGPVFVVAVWCNTPSFPKRTETTIHSIEDHRV